ncbi:chorismate synthase [Candidatus Omnitrophus magneticus]|uniref:Chorismate synthase n=1 Tax=Candidatus Omnitrophus magneticus TaxID=1609969 RepID=A0A0F0CRN2_9BACT|nr:chorismate synthase [Candidatus Omnitrophus magneticus]
MLRYLTAGESHGKALSAILDGIPAGLALNEEIINIDLARRMAGYGRGARMAIEKDKAEITAGIRHGKTIGSPIGLIIWNKDYKIDELPDVLNPRPGHADLSGILKYDFDDARSVLERASARSTAAIVAVGAIAKLLLSQYGIKFFSHVTMLGGITADVEHISFDGISVMAERSSLRCVDSDAEKRMKILIDDAKENGDTLGGVFEVVALGLPVGLGSYSQWDERLDGAIARAVMAIQAVKAVSIGDGIINADKPGSRTHDAIYYNEDSKQYFRKTNRAGGLEGGITNGEPLIVSGFMKPIATLMKPLESVNIKTKEKSFSATERADVTAVPACAVIAEAAIAIEVASIFLKKFGGDSVSEIQRNYTGYLNRLKEK